MHGTTLPLRAPITAAHELGEDLEERATAAEEGAVVAVSGDDGVHFCDGGLHADGDSLLAVVEVAEAADELGLVEGVRGDLHAPHQGHIEEEGEELRGGGCHGARGGFAVVRGGVDGGLDGEGGVGGGDDGGEGFCESGSDAAVGYAS